MAYLKFLFSLPRISPAHGGPPIRSLLSLGTAAAVVEWQVGLPQSSSVVAAMTVWCVAVRDIDRRAPSSLGPTAIVQQIRKTFGSILVNIIGNCDWKGRCNRPRAGRWSGAAAKFGRREPPEWVHRQGRGQWSFKPQGHDRTKLQGSHGSSSSVSSCGASFRC
jgi:hypothetical protein